LHELGPAPDTNSALELHELGPSITVRQLHGAAAAPTVGPLPLLLRCAAAAAAAAAAASRWLTAGP